jgi:hypothetical protein
LLQGLVGLSGVRGYKTTNLNSGQKLTHLRNLSILINVQC